MEERKKFKETIINPSKISMTKIFKEVVHYIDLVSVHADMKFGYTLFKVTLSDREA